MDLDDGQRAAFVEKVDAFAASLSGAEQALLAELLCDRDDDVVGFAFEAGWPGLQVVAPIRFDDPGKIVTSGGGSDIFMADPDKIVATGGGSDI